jgi:hypothetical protein
MGRQWNKYLASLMQFAPVCGEALLYVLTNIDLTVQVSDTTGDE